MERCYWKVSITPLGGTSPLALICDFRRGVFSTVRKMQILYDAASELSQIFIIEGIQCFIGVGPVSEKEIQQEEQWQLVLIPDDNGELLSLKRVRRREILIKELLSFSLHLNQTPAHFLPLKEKEDPNLSSTRVLN